MEKPQRDARKAEARTADAWNGRTTVMSGSGKANKNDVRADDWSIEVKSTSAAGYRLALDDLLKAWEHAAADARKMAFLVEFIRKPGTIPSYKPRRYVVVAEDDFLEMKQELADLLDKIETDC